MKLCDKWRAIVTINIKIMKDAENKNTYYQTLRIETISVDHQRWYIDKDISNIYSHFVKIENIWIFSS